MTIMRTIPTDSADAAEMREVEQARAEAAAATDREHAEQCRDGWLGEDADGRPIPCTVCRPHLAHPPCPMCSTPAAACSRQVELRRGPCCEDCRGHDRGAREFTFTDTRGEQP